MSKIFFKLIEKQLRRPSGLLGSFVGNLMEKGNYPNFSWVIELMSLDNHYAKILEIGYGHGKAIEIILNKFKNVEMYGIDYSELMFKKASGKNRAFIESGQLKLFYGDILEFDFKDLKFDIIFAVNVIYFCNNLSPLFSKLRDLLNPGGQIFIYKSDRVSDDNPEFSDSKVFQRYTNNIVLEELKKANYSEIKIENSRPGDEKGYCFIAKK